MKKIDLEQIHSEAIKRYEASYAAEKTERENCLEDMRFCFVPGAQWEDSAATARKDRPRFEINKIIVPVNNAIGEQRQNRIDIKVRPTDMGASKDVADIFAGIIRGIQAQSSFKDVKDTAFKEIVAGGMGAWYITTEYEDEKSFDQVLKIKSIKSAAASVFYDPSSKDELKRDAQWMMVTTDMDIDVFKAKYPNATASDLTKLPSGYLQDWQTRNTVRVADYWVKVPCIKETVLMSDGSIYELNDKTVSVLDDLAEQGITVVKTRKIRTHKVMMYKISAAEILAGPFEWAGKHIPVVPVFGYNAWIDGQHYYFGMVRHAKDSQRVYNYATSQAIETSALTPKDPYWVTPKQIKGREREYETFNLKNKPFMVYNPDPDEPGPPKRTGAPSVQAALISQVQQADADIQSTTGQYAPALGDQQTDQSGRAILALQRKANASTYELIDNLAKAVEWTGEILIDLIPKIYDTERMVSIMSEDEVVDNVIINQTIIDKETGREVVLNDLSKGRYSVASTIAPSFATQRVEQLNVLNKLAQSNPLFATVAPDLIAQSLDFPFSDDLKKRIRIQLIKQGIVQPTEDEAKELAKQMQPSPQEQIDLKMSMLQLEQQAALVDNLEYQNRKILADIAYKYSQAQNNLTDDIKTKTEINKILEEQGIPAKMPIEDLELQSRVKVMREMNETLDYEDPVTPENIGTAENSPVIQPQMPPGFKPSEEL